MEAESVQNRTWNVNDPVAAGDLHPEPQIDPVSAMQDLFSKEFLFFSSVLLLLVVYLGG